jgi:hypothetical protein
MVVSIEYCADEVGCCWVRSACVMTETGMRVYRSLDFGCVISQTELNCRIIEEEALIPIATHRMRLPDASQGIEAVAP